MRICQRAKRGMVELKNGKFAGKLYISSVVKSWDLALLQ